MGFLNLSAWRPVGGRQPAERRATIVFAQSPKYYYDHLGDFQAIVDTYAEANFHRPKDLLELFLWELGRRGAPEDDEKARDLADLFAYYDIEQNSLLGMVAIDPNKPMRAAKLLEARHQHLERQKRHSAQPAGGASAA